MVLFIWGKHEITLIDSLAFLIVVELFDNKLKLELLIDIVGSNSEIEMVEFAFKVITVEAVEFRSKIAVEVVELMLKLAVEVTSVVFRLRAKVVFA